MIIHSNRNLPNNSKINNNYHSKNKKGTSVFLKIKNKMKQISQETKENNNKIFNKIKKISKKKTTQFHNHKKVNLIYSNNKILKLTIKNNN